jgi:acetyl-CoA C-acetyltransferase
VSHRDNLYSSPAIRHAGTRALELAGVSAAELDHVDLYSCFPVAVQVAARELGLTDRSPLTVTGGLTFAGGPLNNYVMHSIATMVDISRAERGTKNLVTANGGFLTKHAFGVYSSDEPAAPFTHEDLQTQVDAEPTREVIEGFEGNATVETYTVMYDGQGPKTGHIAALTDDGSRVWGSVYEADQVQSLERLGIDGDVIGKPVTIANQIAVLG